MKGALILYSLRNAIDNDLLFFDILKSFYQEHKYGTATTSEFISFVNEKTGKDYNAFFQQYLYHRECPNLEFFNYQIGKGQSCFAYRLNNTIQGFNMPLEVRADGKATKLTATDKTQYFCYPSQSSFSLYHDLYYSATKKNRKLGRKGKD
jgi:predicted metalloprotease with PDZ domain